MKLFEPSWGRPANILLAAAILLPLTPRRAAAHGSLESTASLWVRPTGLDVQIYMSPSSASDLLSKNHASVTVMRDNFATYEQPLAAVAPGLLVISPHDAPPLKADYSVASITDEDDICFKLHFPLPHPLPETLHIHGAYLSTMIDGHVGSFYILNMNNDQIGQGQISADDPDLTVRIASAATQPASPSLATALPAPPAAPPAGLTTSGTTWLLWAIGGSLFILLVFGIVRGQSHKNMTLKKDA